MNKNLLVSAILSGFFLSGSVMAAETASIKISGQINPPACNISTSSDLLSIQNIKLSQLSADKYTSLDQLDTNVSVACEGNATFSIKVRDNSGNTAKSEGVGQDVKQMFSLGESSDKKQLGYYTIRLLPTGSTVDNVVASKMWAKSNNAEWLALPGGMLMFMDNAAVSDTLYDVSVGERAPAKNKRYNLSITPWIAPVGESAAADSINLEGNASFELVYM